MLLCNPIISYLLQASCSTEVLDKARGFAGTLLCDSYCGMCIIIATWLAISFHNKSI